MNIDLLFEIIKEEIKGKKAAIHAYDRMMWTVRSGYLTLVFAGWGFTIKAAVETNKQISTITPYLFLLSAFTITLAIGAFMIDRNYAKRKFRVIVALNKMVELLLTNDLNDKVSIPHNKLLGVLQISGDAANTTYKSPAFSNELLVICIIYATPSILAVFIILFFFIC